MTIYSGYLYTFGMRIWARFSREEPFPLGEAGARSAADKDLEIWRNL